MKPIKSPLRGTIFRRKNTYLGQNGLHRTIFDYVKKHPGKSLKSGLWAAAFNCDASTCRLIARAAERQLREAGFKSLKGSLADGITLQVATKQ